MAKIWIYTFSDHTVEQIPQPEGGCNDTDPMWVWEKVFFISDRNGEFNLFSFDLKGKEIKQLTQYGEFPAMKATTNGQKIIFEREGYLHTYGIKSGQVSKLAVGVAVDLREVWPRYVKGFK